MKRTGGWLWETLCGVGGDAERPVGSTSWGSAWGSARWRYCTRHNNTTTIAATRAGRGREEERRGKRGREETQNRALAVK